MTHPDVAIAPEGSIMLFHLLSPEAEWWVEEHVDADAQWFGGALVVEHRYAGDLVTGMLNDGLRVKGVR